MITMHIHHIIPRHMGGTDDPSNLVELTIEEHAEAHRKLFEEHGNWQDELAWKGLSGMIGKDELLHELYSNKGIRNPMYGKFGKSNPNFGKKRTPESRKKISNALKQLYINGISKERKIQNKQYRQSEEWKSKIRKQVIVNGKLYNSINDAIAITKISRGTFFKKLKDPNNNNISYVH